jgi:hypothetical protein
MKASVKAILFFTLLLIITGCSHGGMNPIMPDSISAPAQNYEASSARSLSESLSIFGAYELTIKDDMTVDLLPMRSSALGESYLVSGIGFFSSWPCSNCLKLHSLTLSPDGYINAVFSVSHPFEKGNLSLPPSSMNRLDLDIFDLAIVIVPSGITPVNFSKLSTETFPDLCAYVDGYTKELSPVLSSSRAFPYYLVVDNTETSTSTYNKFAMGTKDYLFDTYFKGSSARFGLYLTMGYGASAKKFTRLQPVYYTPEFNRKSAWKVEVTPPQGDDPPTFLNTWNSADPITTHEVEVKVWDWQQGVDVATSYPDPAQRDLIFKASDIDSVSVEILGMTSSAVSITSAAGGDGSVADPLIFRVPVANQNQLTAGEYPGLVKVKDERTPATTAGATDSEVHTEDGKLLVWFKIPEFATYQVFTATVVEFNGIIVLDPNGNEFWEIGSQQDIQWTAPVSVSNVDIDLSLNSGGSYTIPIASNTANDGSFTIPSVGSWNTTQARIRVADSADPLTYDQSDADFRISCPVPAVPTGFQATDGTSMSIVTMTWNAVSGADSYSIYRDDVPIQSDITNTTWSDNTASRGVIYTYEIESVNSCGASVGRASDTGYARGCLDDSNNTAATATVFDLVDTVSDCVDQIDSDWFTCYTTPNGLASSSSISFNIAAGTVDVYVYGRDPGYSMPGTLITSATNVGSQTINIPATDKSNIFIKIVGDSGMVSYTMNTNLIPAMSSMNVEIYVATSNGTAGGQWPNTGTPLTHALLLQMMSWTNSFWNPHGYNFVWDGTETIMAANYYVLDSIAEVDAMHNAYGYGKNKMSLYFVQQLEPGGGNTAYSIIYEDKPTHNVNNVYNVYSPNIYSWQEVISHEQGHASAYYIDQYFYDITGCACGNSACLPPEYPDFLYSDSAACYNGNLMWYSVGWTWNQYNITSGQANQIYTFHFSYPANFPWY